MARHHGTGSMRERVAFDPPLNAPDGHGGVETGFDTGAAVERWAEFMHMRGGESREAAREQGTALIKVRVRSSVAARGITEAWRMRDLHRGAVYNIREVDAVTDRAWVWIEAERGVAV